MNITEWFREHSTVIFIVLIGIVGGVAFLKKNPAPSTITPAAGIDTTGLQTDANGNPIIYRDTGDTFLNVVVHPNDTQPVASAPGGSTEHPIEPGTPGSSSTGSTTHTTQSNGGTNSSTTINQNGGNAPTDGLLGPNVEFVPPSSYKNQAGIVTPIPLPSGTQYRPGKLGRVWYITPGSKLAYLLTSGTGGPVTNSPHPVGQ